MKTANTCYCGSQNFTSKSRLLTFSFISLDKILFRTLYTILKINKKPWATGRMIGVSSPGRGWESFYSPQRPGRFWGPPNFLSNGYKGLSVGIKRPEREADHSTSSSAEVKNAWSYTSTSTERLHVVLLN
jgi:hypothetical protein